MSSCTLCVVYCGLASLKLVPLNNSRESIRGQRSVHRMGGALFSNENGEEEF